MNVRLQSVFWPPDEQLGEMDNLKESFFYLILAIGVILMAYDVILVLVFCLTHFWKLCCKSEKPEGLSSILSFR